MVQFRLPKVNNDDGIWGDELRQYLMKEHYDDGTDNSGENGGHQNITIRAGSTTKAPIKITAGSPGSNLLTTPAAGSVEYDGTYFYITPASTRYQVVGDTQAQTLTNKTLTSPVINTSISGSAVSTAASASTLALRDGQKNLFANNFNSGFTAILTTNAAVTALNNSSTYQQWVNDAPSGTVLDQTYKLPDVTTLAQGWAFFFYNNSAKYVYINSFSGTGGDVFIIAPGAVCPVYCVSATDNTAAGWVANQLNVWATPGNSAIFNDSFNFTSGGGYNYAFPTVDDTIVGEADVQTLTNKTLTSPKINSIKDTNGKTIVDLSATASAVNYLQVVNSVTGFSPGLNAAGTDSLIDVVLRPKGAGALQIYSANDTPKILATGPGGNDNLNLATQGTGHVQVNGFDALAANSYTPAAKTANYSVLATDHTFVYFANASTGNVTITLPAASTVTGYRFDVKRIDGSANIVSVASAGGTIDGAASWTLDMQYTSITVVSDGSNWYIL